MGRANQRPFGATTAETTLGRANQRSFGAVTAATASAAFVLFAFFAAAASAEKIGSIEANVQPVASMDTHGSGTAGVRHGCVEYRVQLKNSSAEDRTVVLSHPGEDVHRYFTGVQTTRTVVVPGGQEVLVPLFVRNDSNSVTVEVEEERKDRRISVGNLFRYYGDDAPVAILVSRSVPQEFRDRAYAKPKTKPGESTSPSPPTPPVPMGGMGGMPGMGGPASPSETQRDPFAMLRSELPVNQWSPNWLGYSCYDAILMTAEEAGQMPPAVQLAIRRYVECGGTLLVHGRKAPDVFTQGGVADSRGGYVVGFGRVAPTLRDDKSDWATTYDALKRAPPHIYRPEQKPSESRDGLLVAEATVPVRGLFVLVCLFGIGIGPANLWWLSRRKRRIWLWWNVPLLSMLTCLAVFGYSVASEGWRGHGRTASLTLLDQRCHRATTIGYVSYYCPLTPSSGPRFGVNTDVALLSNQPYNRFSSDSVPQYVDWTEDQHLTSGWVNARVPAYFQFRKSEDRRERLTVEKLPDGSLKIVNALGAGIERLSVADAEGRVFEGRDIPAGAERTLVSRGKKTGKDSGLAALQHTFRNAGWLNALSAWLERQEPAAELAPGSYIAMLDQSPFVETPLENVESKHTASIVYGIVKEL